MSGALVFIQNDTTKKTLWVSADNPLPVTGTFTPASGSLIGVKGVDGTGIATNANPFPVSDAGGSITVDQATASLLNAQVVGNVAAGVTDSGNPVKIGGKYSATLPTLTDGWRGDVQLTSRGALFAAMSGLSQGLANGLSSIVNPYTSTSLGGASPIGALQYVYNGATIDMMAKPNVSKRIASSAASGNPDFLKAAAGNLTKFWGLNGAAITYVQIYNKASAPTIGTDTPILTYPVAANASFDVTIPNGGLYFATGIAYAFTTDAAGTTGAGAAAVTACNIIGA